MNCPSKFMSPTREDHGVRLQGFAPGAGKEHVETLAKRRRAKVSRLGIFRIGLPVDVVGAGKELLFQQVVGLLVARRVGEYTPGTPLVSVVTCQVIEHDCDRCERYPAIMTPHEGEQLRRPPAVGRQFPGARGVSKNVAMLFSGVTIAAPANQPCSHIRS